MEIGVHKYYKRLRKIETFNYGAGKDIVKKRKDRNIFKGIRFNFDR